MCWASQSQRPSAATGSALRSPITQQLDLTLTTSRPPPVALAHIQVRKTRLSQVCVNRCWGFFVKEPSKLHGVKDTLCALSVPPPRVTKPLRLLAATWEKGG